MRILALQPYLPYPVDTGGNLRSHYVLSTLTNLHEVDLLSFSWEPSRQNQIADWNLHSRLRELRIIAPADPQAPFDPQRLSAGAKALRECIPGTWFGAPDWIRFHDIPEFWNSLASLPLPRYEGVHVRNMHLAPYALALQARFPSLKLILDLDDISSVDRRRSLKSLQPRWISRWRLHLYTDALRLRLYEGKFLRRFDSVWVCSEEDRRTIARWMEPERAHVVPNAVDVSSYPRFARERTGREAPRLIFCGELSRSANSAAALYFYQSIWPLIRAEIPEARWLIAGRNPPPSISALQNSAAGVEVLANVPSMMPHLASSTLMVVPLLSGAGTRLKILESMASGLPVVSTTLGAEGLGLQPGEHALIADDPESFARSCIAILRDRNLGDRLAQAALHFVRERYDLPVMERSVIDAYQAVDQMRQDRALAAVEG